MWHMIITEISLTKRWRRKTSLLKFWQKKKKKKKKKRKKDSIILKYTDWIINFGILTVRQKNSLMCAIKKYNGKSDVLSIWQKQQETLSDYILQLSVWALLTLRLSKLISTVKSPDSLTNSGLLRVAEWWQTWQTSAKLCYEKFKMINACL